MYVSFKSNPLHSELYITQPDSVLPAALVGNKPPKVIRIIVFADGVY